MCITASWFSASASVRCWVSRELSMCVCGWGSGREAGGRWEGGVGAATHLLQSRAASTSVRCWSSSELSMCVPMRRRQWRVWSSWSRSETPWSGLPNWRSDFFTGRIFSLHCTEGTTTIGWALHRGQTEWPLSDRRVTTTSYSSGSKLPSEWPPHWTQQQPKRPVEWPLHQMWGPNHRPTTSQRRTPWP